MFILPTESKYSQHPSHLDPRLANLITPTTSAQDSPGLVLAGYPDDEGIKINNGRPGAHLGPQHVREQLYRMTPGFKKSTRPLYELGNLNTPSLDLLSRHEFVKNTSYEYLKKGHRWVSIGGGHDYGYPDGSAFLKHTSTQGQKPLILNFDAHLDVRPSESGLSSGTPFYRLYNDETSFDLAQIGIQPQCNSLNHYSWCKERGAKIIEFNSIQDSPLNCTEFILKELQPWLEKKRPTFISVDIDCFSSSVAMGCSQSWPNGFTAEMFFPLFKALLSHLDVISLGIYEVSPPLDLDDRTSKLAAQIIYSYMNAYAF